SQAPGPGRGGWGGGRAGLQGPGSKVGGILGGLCANNGTNYWGGPTPEEEAAQTRAEMELQQAEIAAWAAKAAGVSHVIWSTLEDTRQHFGDDDRVPNIDGPYKVPHFDAKGEADELFVKYGIPTTFLRTTLYFEGMTSGLGPVRDST